MTREPICVDWLARWTRYAPDSVALVDDPTGRSFTYAGAAAAVAGLAEELRARTGLRRGDRVAVLAPNSVDYVLLLFAVQRLGAILVPLNHRLAAPELAYVLADAKPTLLVVDPGLESLVAGLPAPEEETP